MSFRLGHLLVEQKRLTLEQVDQAFHRQQIFGGSLDTQLLELGWMEPSEVQEALSKAYEDRAPLMEWIERPAVEALLRIPPALALQLELIPVREEQGTLHLLTTTGALSDQWPLSYWLGQDIKLHYVLQFQLMQGLSSLFGQASSRRWRQLQQRFSSEIFLAPSGWLDASSVDDSSPLLQRVQALRETVQSNHVAADHSGTLEMLRTKRPRVESVGVLESAGRETEENDVSSFVESTPHKDEQDAVEMSNPLASTQPFKEADVLEDAVSLKDLPHVESLHATKPIVNQEPFSLQEEKEASEHVESSSEKVEISEQIEAYVVDEPLPRKEDSLVELDAAMLVEEESQDELDETSPVRKLRNLGESGQALNAQSEPAKNSPAEKTESLEPVGRRTTPPTGEAKLSLPPVASLRSAFRPVRNKEMGALPAVSGVEESIKATWTEPKPAETQTAEPASSTKISKSSQDTVLPKEEVASIDLATKRLHKSLDEAEAKVSVLRAQDAKKWDMIVEAEPTLMLGKDELISEEATHTIAMTAMPSNTSVQAEAVDLREQGGMDSAEMDAIEIDVDLGASLEPPPSSTEAPLAKNTVGSPDMMLDDMLNAPLHRVPQLLESLSAFGADVVLPMLERLPAQEVVGKNTDLEEKLERMVMLCEKIDEPVLLRLIRVLQKEAPPSRMRALTILSKWLSSRAISHLIRHLLNEQDPTVRRMTRKVILSYKEEGGFEKLLPFLTENLQSGEVSRIQNALQLVEELRIVEMIPELIKLLTIKDKDLRDQCLRVLRRLALQSFGLDGRQWGQWYSLQTKKTRKHWILESINHEDDSIRRMVQDDLRDEFGDDFGYDPNAAPAQRESIRKLAALWLQQR